jgi:hypothetical protein
MRRFVTRSHCRSSESRAVIKRVVCRDRGRRSTLLGWGARALRIVGWATVSPPKRGARRWACPRGARVKQTSASARPRAPAVAAVNVNLLRPFPKSARSIRSCAVCHAREMRHECPREGQIDCSSCGGARCRACDLCRRKHWFPDRNGGRSLNADDDDLGDARQRWLAQALDLANAGLAGMGLAPRLASLLVGRVVLAHPTLPARLG